MLYSFIKAYFFYFLTKHLIIFSNLQFLAAKKELEKWNKISGEIVIT